MPLVVALIHTDQRAAVLDAIDDLKVRIVSIHPVSKARKPFILTTDRLLELDGWMLTLSDCHDGLNRMVPDNVGQIRPDRTPQLRIEIMAEHAMTQKMIDEIETAIEGLGAGADTPCVIDVLPLDEWIPQPPEPFHSDAFPRVTYGIRRLRKTLRTICNAAHLFLMKNRCPPLR